MSNDQIGRKPFRGQRCIVMWGRKERPCRGLTEKHYGGSTLHVGKQAKHKTQIPNPKKIQKDKFKKTKSQLAMTKSAEGPVGAKDV